MARLKTSLYFTAALSALALPGLASAADIDAGDMDEEDSEGVPAEGLEDSAEEAAEGETPEATTPVDEGTKPKKEWDPNALQFEVGARARLMVVPKFLINAFKIEGGQDIVAPAIGAEGGFAKGNFEGLFGIWYAGYNAGPMPFKGPTDGQEAWERVQSNAGALYLTADLLFRGEVARGWHWFFGGGVGVGIITGHLRRQETYWADPYSPAFPGDPYNNLVDCPYPPPMPPDPLAAQCPPGPTDDNRYDFSLGTTSPIPWPVYPWLTMQTGVRYQPNEHLITRLDLGIGSSGFWLGLAVDYGL